MASIEYAIRSKDQSKAGIQSAEAGIQRLHKSVENFSRLLTGTFMGGATLMAFRTITRGIGDMLNMTVAGTNAINGMRDAIENLKMVGAQGLTAALVTPINEGEKALRAFTKSMRALMPPSFAMPGGFENTLTGSSGAGTFGAMMEAASQNQAAAALIQETAWARITQGMDDMALRWQHGFGDAAVLDQRNAAFQRIVDGMDDMTARWVAAGRALAPAAPLGTGWTQGMENPSAYGAPGKVRGKDKGEAAATGGLGDFLGSLFQSLGGSIGMIVHALTLATPLFALLIPIFNGLMGVLGPLVDNILAPFIGFLTIIGQTIGKFLTPILTALQPAFDLLAQVLAFLYNYIMLPIVNGLMLAFNLLYNLITGIWNAIVDVLNSIHIGSWYPFGRQDRIQARAWDQDFLKPVSVADMRNAGNAEIGAGAGGAGVGATYSGAPTYNISISNYFGTASVIDSSGTWNSFLDKVMVESMLREAARQGA